MTDLTDTNAPMAAPVATPVAAPERLMKWFIIHTYSGYEAKVMEHLRQRIKMEEREAFFGDIQVPEETYEESHEGGAGGERGGEITFYYDQPSVQLLQDPHVPLHLRR